MSASEISWGKRDSLKAYNVRRWGIKYFDINNQGNVTVSPLKEKGGAVEIVHVVKEAERRGLRLPLVIRFQDLLRNRVEEINESFRRSIAELGYQGRYQGVFPIKVNQLREVVEEILDAGAPYNFGIEAGSKAELFAALAMVSGQERLIICNGYKDALFIRMALSGKRLGKRVILVVEKLSELRQILARSPRARRGARSRRSAFVCTPRGEASGKPRAATTRSSACRPRTCSPPWSCCARRAGCTASSSFIFTSARRSPTFGRSVKPSPKRRGSMPSSTRTASRSSTSTRAAGSASTTTVAARSSTARPTTASRSTPTTSSWRSRRSATTSRSLTPTSSPRAAARWSPITRFSSSRSSARSRRAARYQRNRRPQSARSTRSSRVCARSTAI